MTAGAAPGDTPPEDLVEMGFVRGSYGLQGWVHVQPHSGEAQVLRSARRWWMLPARAGEVAQALQLTGVRSQGAALVAKWRGCEDPESAQACTGRAVAVSRADFPALPEGQYYWVDLVGAAVINRGGQHLGSVRELRSNGVHDLLVVDPAAAEGADAGRDALLIPMVAAYVDGIDIDERRIRVDWDLQW